MLQIRILVAQDHDPTFWSSRVFACQNPPHFHDSSFRNMPCCCSTCLVSNPVLHFYILCLFELLHLLIGQILYSHFASMFDLVYSLLSIRLDLSASSAFPLAILATPVQKCMLHCPYMSLLAETPPHLAFRHVTVQPVSCP